MSATSTTATDPVLNLLQAFHNEKLGLLLTHQAGARWIGRYNFNNAYQYLIEREEAHVSWLARAVTEMGGALATPAGPDRKPARQGDEAERAIMNEDARDAQAFVDRWRAPVEALTHARHRTMLRVILGETLEHKRFFQQAAAGQEDLLGRRMAGAGTPGHVIDERWIE